MVISGIVIVGGGICGLATALALHRKGYESLVVERADSLRTSGADTISVYTNGWRALDQLGVGKDLRETALFLCGGEEFRVLNKGDIIRTLANNLPPNTIRFGIDIVDVELDPITSDPVLQLRDGNVIKAKVVIGCDGVESVVAKWLRLKATKLLPYCGVRGFTNYPNGHDLGNEILRLSGDQATLSRTPIDDKLVYWLLTRKWTPQDSRDSKDTRLIRDSTLKYIKDFPEEVIEMINNSELGSLTLHRMRFHTPWDLLIGNFRKGKVTVAGDAMHVMIPLLGQSASLGLEDSIVLARCLDQEIYKLAGPEESRRKQVMQENKNVEAAFDRYVKERRMRLLKISTQSYLTGLLQMTSSSMVKIGLLLLLLILFGKSISHAKYDCGRL
ncbi:monooxygenase 1-like isoform X2 [Telopea speciosissima]|uniref:monooxygenase 1-like isoform X2 n=1 Tax=Telopea speciosissima TaxID=54955 RepID=UPI001CC4A04D|nr:monooxygenase 1-like isoform X2 [Telopea speciosissima]